MQGFSEFQLTSIMTLLFFTVKRLYLALGIKIFQSQE